MYVRSLKAVPCDKQGQNFLFELWRHQLELNHKNTAFFTATPTRLPEDSKLHSPAVRASHVTEQFVVFSKMKLVSRKEAHF